MFAGHKVTGVRANTGTPAKRKTSVPASAFSDPRTARSFTPEPQSSQFLPQQRYVQASSSVYELYLSCKNVFCKHGNQYWSRRPAAKDRQVCDVKADCTGNIC